MLTKEQYLEKRATEQAAVIARYGFYDAYALKLYRQHKAIEREMAKDDCVTVIH